MRAAFAERAWGMVGRLIGDVLLECDVKEKKQKCRSHQMDHDVDEVIAEHMILADIVVYCPAHIGQQPVSGFSVPGRVQKLLNTQVRDADTGVLEDKKTVV